MTDHTAAKIKSAARKIFLQKGFDGSRMQEIADNAGINKALLHYYYHSKETLFEQIFEDAIENLFPKIWDELGQAATLRQLIEKFTDLYINFLKQEPLIPQFILHELNRDQQRTGLFIEKLRPQILRFQQLIQKHNLNECAYPYDYRHIFINMISMLLFPFLARPVASKMLFHNDQKAYEGFLEQRSAVVSDSVIRMIESYQKTPHP